MEIEMKDETVKTYSADSRGNFRSGGCGGAGGGRNILAKFANTTSLHAVPRVILSKSLPVRCLWAAVFIAAVGMFTFQLTQLVQRYVSYPKKVSIEVVDNDGQFPLVTVCNMQHLDLGAILSDKSLIFNEEYRRYFKNYKSIENKFKEIVAQEEHEEVFDALNESYSRLTLSANFPKDNIQEAGIQMSKFIVSCVHGSHECYDMNQVFDPYYFNCFTIRNNKSAAEGISNGMSVVFLTGSGIWIDAGAQSDKQKYPGLHDRYQPTSGSDGIRVVIHPRTTYAFPLTEGYDVPPGTSVSLAIKSRRNKRIGPPHGRCSQSNSFDLEIFRNKYSTFRTISCHKMCIQIRVIEECGCYDMEMVDIDKIDPKQIETSTTNPPQPCQHNNDLPEDCDENIIACIEALRRQYKRITCAWNVESKLDGDTNAMVECGCHPPCEEVVYDVSYSLSEWPGKGYESAGVWHDIFDDGSFQKNFDSCKKEKDLYEEYFSFEKWTSTKKDFARINVYMAESTMIETVESPEYDAVQLISDIGGQIGLWLGMSVITLWDTLALFGQLVMYVLGKESASRSRHMGDVEIGSIP